MTLGQIVVALVAGAAGIAFFVYADQTKDAGGKATAIFFGILGCGIAFLALALKFQ